MFHTLEVFTTVVVGVLVGVEFSVLVIMSRILNALPEDSAQQGHAHGGRMLGAVMPYWYIGSSVLVAAWAVTGWHHHGAGLVVAAGALLILSVIMSILLLVPINNRNKTWTPEDRPADWRDQLDRWQRFHYARVAVIIAAFATLVTALT
ncbi:anthrone oxygenase family protein [Streptomyces sp. NPDC048416]|uniref:anthrone oxygenase family protein n=1 Tax=Streptomyces sp. NPDC048416 TaxID=3365546 RepID=UPI0037134F04